MSPLASAHVDLYGRRVPSRTAFAVLAAGTVLMIGLSCWLEEIILRKLPGWRFHWTMAFFELAVFGGVAYLSSHGAARVAPLRLYVAGAACMGLYSAAGKMAYDYVNYATGTVLKSAKLVPVMAVSVLWLRRTYHPLDYLAAALMTASAALFGLGERELSPDGNTTAGFLLSFLCLALAAAQSNVSDKCLRDFGASVDENMLYTNGLGAAFVLVFLLAGTTEAEEATAYFYRKPEALVLLVIRSATFYLGAWSYTLLMKHFGAVAAVAVTTTRKALTVMVSFVVFGGDKPLTMKYASAAALFFAAAGCEYLKTKSGAGGGGKGGNSHGGGENPKVPGSNPGWRGGRTRGGGAPVRVGACTRRGGETSY